MLCYVLTYQFYYVTISKLIENEVYTYENKREFQKRCSRNGCAPAFKGQRYVRLSARS